MSIRTPFLATAIKRIVSGLCVRPASAGCTKLKTLDSDVGSTDSGFPARAKTIPPTEAALLRSFGYEPGDRDFNHIFPTGPILR